MKAHKGNQICTGGNLSDIAIRIRRPILITAMPNVKITGNFPDGLANKDG